jgi:hypothetical protein
LPPVVGHFSGTRGEFSIRKTLRAEPFSFATSGSTSLRTPRAWSSRSRRTAVKPGK